MERRHLVIVHEPGWSDLDDWRTIARHIAERAPDLRTYIVNNADTNALLSEVASRAPTLVVSPGPLRVFRPLRGRLYAGRRVSKVDQLTALAAGGIAVPRWRRLAPGEPFDAAGWDTHVVVKPADGLSSAGVGVRLMATSEIDGVAIADMVERAERGSGSVLVQAFINTGPRLEYFRVLTLFGRPLYCLRTMLRKPIAVDAEGVPAAGVGVANQHYERADKHMDLVLDPAVMALAASCYAVLPGQPLHGVDVLRSQSDGRLHVLELNPGGNTWHFSSSHSRGKGGADPVFEAAKREQFDAFSIAADVLLERTRAEAL